MTQPKWEDVGGGNPGVTLMGVDQNPVTLLKEVWDFKATKHANLEQNWDAFVETVESAIAVHESRLDPDRTKVYYKHFPKLVREDGRVAQGTLIVVVDRPLARVVSVYIPDHFLGKLGKKLWP